MRRANRPKLDDDGFAIITVGRVENKMVDDVRALKKGLPPDECRYECYDFEFICPGTSGEFRFRERTGAVLNSEPVETKYRGTVKIYNKLTSVILGAGLSTVEDLDTADVDELKAGVLALEGKRFRANMVKVDGFYRVNLSTLVPVETSEPEDK